MRICCTPCGPGFCTVCHCRIRIGQQPLDRSPDLYQLLDCYISGQVDGQTAKKSGCIECIVALGKLEVFCYCKAT